MTTNTHIAAQPTDDELNKLAEHHTWFNGSHAMTNYPAFARAVLKQYGAKALEAAPALDAQGEARNAIHLELLRDLISNDAYALSFQTMGQYRTAILKAFAAKPPPPAVGKPLSEEEIVLDGVMGMSGEEALDCTKSFEAGVRFAEKRHGIVTKETGT